VSREPLRLAPTAINLAYNDPEENLRRMDAAIAARVAKAPEVARDSLLFVFPELTLTGFVTKAPKAQRLDPPDAAISGLFALAKKHGVGLVAGFPERGEGKPRNCLVLIGPDGRLVSAYRKMHLFTVGDNPESANYAAGDEAVLCEYRGWKVGLAVCFDVRFPALFQEYAKAGADLVVVSACWIGGPHKSEQYRTLNSAHAILAQAFVAAVNQSGKDPHYEYDGAEYVFSPFGDALYAGEPCLLDPERLSAVRRMRVRSADRERYPLKTG